MKAKNIVAPETRIKRLRVPILYTMVFHSLVFCFLAWMIYSSYQHRYQEPAKTTTPDNSQSEKLLIVRNQDYKFVKPLRLTDLPDESVQLKEVKHDILLYLENQKKAGQISDASVYLRRLNDGSWMSINENEAFKPGSMFKIPLLIYFLKMAELHPGYLSKELNYTRPFANPKNETFKGSSLVVGKKYKIDDLLKKMIIQSDNIATTLLLFNLEKPALYQKIYSDLGIPVPDPYDNNYTITAKDISKFMRVLYSSTYLEEESSEYALELLVQSSFEDGLAKKLPKDLKIARKFGEAGDTRAPEFSETGIVFSGNNAYLITVMTKGTEPRQQAEAIGEISKIVYNKMKE
jgi:beta-lactamase class A